ncbi:MAG: hypothetical protein AB1491_13790 [Thermodesulfobacteriota bacterium]
MKKDVSQRIEEVKARLCEMQEELVSLENQKRQEISKKFKFPFTKSYKYTTEVTVDIPLPLSKERRTFRLQGQKTFEFSQSEHPGIAKLRVVDDRFTMESISLTVDRLLGFLHKVLKVPRTTIHSEAIHYQTTEGHLDLVTGHYSCQFTMLLTPKVIPVLSLLGVEELPLVIHETGRLDFKPKGRISAAGRVDFPQAYTGPLRILAFYIKDDCPTRVSLCGTVDGSKCTEKGKIYIAAGDRVYLQWSNSADVQAAQIEPSIGSVPPNGLIATQPQVDTEYTIIAHGACEARDSLSVRVLKDDDQVDILALHIVEKEFRDEIPPQFCSPRLWTKLIEPRCTGGCFVDKILVATNYGKAFNNKCNGWYCHGSWNGFKDDHTGLHSFPVTPGASPIGWPLEGLWRFSPANVSTPPIPLFGVAFFKVTVEVKE